MPDRPPFPIPEVIDPPKMCLQLCIPDDPTWKRVINGLLSELGQWYNWQRDEGRSGKELAQVWRETYNQIDWSNMSCCCGDNTPLMYRWTEDGHYQSSDDGGTTWVDAPENDPRYSVPMFPPVLPEGVEEPECVYADSAVNVLKVQFVEAIEVGDSLQVIIGIIIGVLSAVLGTVAAPLVYQIMAVIAGAILAFTIEAFQDAFTTEVWDRLRCNLLDNMGADGEFSSSQVDEIYGRIGSEETGIVYLVLRQAIAAFGAVGLTNAARSGAGDVDADCSECEDTTCLPESWWGYMWYEGAWLERSVFVSSDENSITLDSVDRGDGEQIIAFSVKDRNTCCLVQWEYVGTVPDPALLFYTQCGTPADYADNVQNQLMGDCNEVTSYFFQYPSGTTWRVKFTFVGECV